MIQIDGSWDKLTGYGGAAWVATQRFQPSQSQGRFLLADSALRTETEACFAAIKWARTVPLTNILILTDSTSLVTLLGSKSEDDITIHHTLNAIRAEAGHIPRCRLMKVSRDQVQEAHNMAILCRSSRINLD